MYFLYFNQYFGGFAEPYPAKLTARTLFNVVTKTFLFSNHSVQQSHPHKTTFKPGITKTNKENGLSCLVRSWRRVEVGEWFVVSKNSKTMLQNLKYPF